MTQKAKGTFEVKLIPQTDTEITAGRFTLEKSYSGELEGTAKGQMLSARSAIPNSAGYVAIEKVEGSLHGKRGSFVLQHSSIMNRGEATQSIAVVPDSGTEELEGLSGNLLINIADGKHYYEFDYSMDR
jgi:hypothetical protein